MFTITRHVRRSEQSRWRHGRESTGRDLGNSGSACW